MASLIYSIIGIVIAIQWIIKKFRRKTPKKEKEIIEKKPSLISEFYHSKKEKYCKKIEWL
ncbi:MAG: hypothetical protein V1781_04405 [Bacteroidota bacterium]